MNSVRKCKATLKSGKPCGYGAKEKSVYCGIHAPRESQKPTETSPAERDAKLALIVSTGLALVEIVEKALTHYPALLKLLESFSEFTGNRWRYAEVMPALRALASYKSTMDPTALFELGYRDPFGRGKSPDAASAENTAIVIAIHNVALTHWATSTLLAEVTPEGSGYRSFGDVRLESSIPSLSPKEREALLQIYRTCRQIPFIDDLRTSNFLSMWAE